MFKIFKLFLLTCLLASTQLSIAQDDDSSEDELETVNHPYGSETVGNPLLSRRFFITINSAKSLVAAGRMSAISAIGWFFHSPKKIIKLANLTPPDPADELFKLKIVEIKLNQNYANAVNFKTSVTQNMPEAENAILISREGFYCDENFCQHAGNEKYGMGVCTPYYCDCTKETPEPNRCRTLLQAFDPVYMNCDEAYKVKICGF